MKKFILVKDNKEIKLGDNFVLSFLSDTCLGKDTKVTMEVKVTEPVLDMLIENGYVKVVDELNKINSEFIVDYVFSNLQQLTKWKGEKLVNILSTISSVNQWAAMQILLKEIAIKLDQKYDGHISKSGEIYAISPQDLEVHKIDKSTIKNYTLFPAFRSKQDAELAKSIIENYFSC